MIRARVEPDLKSEVEGVFSELGLSPTEAITLFYKQVAIHNGLPFPVRIPNAVTIAAIEDVRDGMNSIEYADSDDLIADIE
jgi:DNA-damage-inducible protein J